eukprot:Seg1091.7 transcript_id=Seg1091.7/GoldUCD/mRNA.D3Y31 product="Gamma-aminobutyric acid receptor subunit alpha-6" protein_id=Seg1091.7/GoldUCD/D3Y31
MQIFISWKLVISLLQSNVIQFSASIEYGENVTAVLQRLLSSYDKRMRPDSGGPPVVVRVGLSIVKLQDINDEEGVYGADFYIRMRWKDSRLCHNGSNEITLQETHDKDFWAPDIFFENALKSTKHEVLKQNHYIRISQDGSIISSTRVSIIADCPVDLTSYPFDVQQCQLVMECYSYATHDLILEWNPVEKNRVNIRRRELKQFIVKAVTTSAINGTYLTGIFSGLTVTFMMERRIGHYIFHVFIPCIIVVMLSFLSFWMSPEDVDRLGEKVKATEKSVITGLGQEIDIDIQPSKM